MSDFLNITFFKLFFRCSERRARLSLSKCFGTWCHKVVPCFFSKAIFFRNQASFENIPNLRKWTQISLQKWGITGLNFRVKIVFKAMGISKLALEKKQLTLCRERSNCSTPENAFHDVYKRSENCRWSCSHYRPTRGTFSLRVDSMYIDFVIFDRQLSNHFS